MSRLERVARARLLSKGLDPDERVEIDRSAMGAAWENTDNLIEARRFVMMFEAATGETE